jgi:hypothetical protein
MHLVKKAVELLQRKWPDDPDAQAFVVEVLNAAATPEEVKRARDLYQNDDEEIDDNALTSETDDGVWVSGWFWLPNPDDDYCMNLRKLAAMIAHSPAPRDLVPGVSPRGDGNEIIV